MIIKRRKPNCPLPPQACHRGNEHFAARRAAPEMATFVSKTAPKMRFSQKKVMYKKQPILDHQMCKFCQFLAKNGPFLTYFLEKKHYEDFDLTPPKTHKIWKFLTRGGGPDPPNLVISAILS